MNETGAPPAPAASLGELLDHAPCGFASVGDDGTLTAVNTTLAELLGYAREELEGRRVDTILTVGTRLFYQTHFFPLLRMQGRADEIYLMLRARDGSDVGVLTNAVRRERGGTFANDCVFMRVLERRKFEDELLRARREAEQARAAAEEASAELQLANDALEQQAMELELQHQQLQEQTFELETQGEELRSINDELLERTDELLERTDELERQRVVAEEANRAKSSFLAMMSHELRTPLNAIGGYVQLLEMGIHGPVTPAQQEALDRIGRSQQHLLRLINEVLNLARIEAGRVEYLIEDVDVAALMEAVSPMLEPQMAARRLDYRIAVEPGLAMRADRDKVQQIVINLLSNAVKFTPEGGSVAVEAEAGDGVVRLRVTDTGIGIPPEKQAAVFEPYVQVDESQSRRAQGTGLGMAISRDLARGMGGNLTLASEEGRGSTFTLLLPRAAPAQDGA